MGHLSDVEVVRFHPNCNYVLTGSSDHTCRLWDVQKGACVRIFAKHSGPITCASISSDGKTLASAGYIYLNIGTDNVIKLWDIGSGRCIKSMSGHTGTINSLEFSKNGSMLASGSGDDTVRLWDTNKSTDDYKRY